MTNDLAFDFSGSTALVTGGTSGIGHATAIRLRDCGAAVTITGTKPDPSHYAVDLSGLSYRSLDLTDASGTEALATEFATLDILINNAGANFPGGLDESTAAGFEASVNVNLLAPFRLTAAMHGALRDSEASGGASVVMLASMAAVRAVAMVPGYGAAKAGVLSLTRNLSMQWAGDGIRVNAVVPGVIATPMTAPMEHFPEVKQGQLNHIPLGRFGTPAEIADAILFLCTHNAAYCTGSALVVDGGYSVQ
ncbi:oxidoreductase [Mycolicibacterium acapulense]|nr:oxidoreductase [Mycolicibacterium acapulense]KUI03208.1 oxidoreductase [Mycolicibacterium acapulense]